MTESVARLRLRSVRVRMTVAATLVVALTVTLASFLIVKTVRHRLVGAIEKQTQVRVKTLSEKLASGVPPGGLPLTLPAPGTGFVTVQDGEGNVLKSVGNVYVKPGFLIGEAPPGKSGVTTVEGIDGPFSVQYASVPTPEGAFTVVVGSPLDGVRRSISTLQSTLAVGTPLLIVLVGALAWFLTGRALRPVENIRAEVEAISAGTLHRRVPEPATGDEVSRLARTMNAMLDRLESAATRQRQFVSDASHELRSPVTTIRTQLEVALANPERTDWPDVARRALVEEARLEALVTDLLLLASTDEQRDLAGAAAVDVDALVAEEGARPRPVPVTVETSGGDMTVLGRTDQLARVIVNLLDNACRYARTRVDVSLTRTKGEVHVAIDDDGPGIPVQDRRRVFERFTRLDASRTRAQPGGAGLGLALAKAVVERHHGTITVDDAPIGGARFLVTLPGVTA